MARGCWKCAIDNPCKRGVFCFIFVLGADPRLHDVGRAIGTKGEMRMSRNVGSYSITSQAVAWLKKQWKYQIGYGMVGGG